MCNIPAIRPHGRYESEPLPDGWANEDIWFRRSNGHPDHRIEIIHLATRERYPQEPMIVISIKCAVLFFLTPVYFFFYSIVQTLRVAIVPIANSSPLALVNELWHIVKIPFCFVGMELAALYGVANPVQGRSLFGKCESILHGDKTRRAAEQYLKKERLPSEMLKDALLVEEPDRALFLAFCFQALGSKDDSHILERPPTDVQTLPSV